MVRRLAYSLILLLSYTMMSAGNRYALTVFISEYPQESGWNRLNSANDKSIILPMLHGAGYSESSIICLEDKEATYANIIKAMESLSCKVAKGDEVYIHFSCHGQQITDIDGDEALADPKDKYDEALVPYDAYISYDWNGYKGDKHLLDDEINQWLHEISVSVGKDGTVLFIADACHSGDLVRTKKDKDYSGFRGTFDRFQLPLRAVAKTKQRRDLEWVSISACKDFQTNYECEEDGVRYGRLSLAVARSMKKGMTAAQLVDAIKAEYTKMALPKGKAQTPEAEYPKNYGQKVLFR